MKLSKHLFAAYAWSFHHVGDGSIMPGLLSLVHSNKPELPVHMMTYQTEEHHDYLHAEEYMRQYSPDCYAHPNVFRRLLNEKLPESEAWRAFVERWGWLALENFEQGRLSDSQYTCIAEDILERLPLEIFSDLQKTRPKTALAIADAGFVIYNSSTSLSYGRLGSRKLWKAILPMMMPMLIARALGIPYGFSPLSFEALDWPIPLIYKKLFGEARFLYCRDSDSLLYLQQHGLLNRHSGVRPDNCLHFTGYDDLWAEQFMNDHALQHKGFIGLMLRIADPRPDSGDPLSSAVSSQRFNNQMEKNKQFVEQWIVKTGMKVLICHETIASIQSTREHLWDQLSDETRRHCIYVDHIWSPEQARSIYKRMRMLVSMELHSAILALSAGTPIMHHPLQESGRKREMLVDIGLEDWLFDIDECTANELASAALRIHNDYAHSVKRLSKILPDLRNLGNAMVSEMGLNWGRNRSCKTLGPTR